MKKRSVRINRFTRRPRKWTCCDNSAIDAKLEEAEMWHYFSRLAKAKGVAFTVEVVPIEILRRLVEQDRHTLGMLEKFLNAIAKPKPFLSKISSGDCQSFGRVAPRILTLTQKVFHLARPH
jgi:hypothetical protein